MTNLPTIKVFENNSNIRLYLKPNFKKRQIPVPFIINEIFKDEIAWNSHILGVFWQCNSSLLCGECNDKENKGVMMSIIKLRKIKQSLHAIKKEKPT